MVYQPCCILFEGMLGVLCFCICLINMHGSEFMVGDRHLVLDSYKAVAGESAMQIGAL